jgi:RNA polymerase sigma factor (sigma-70 family)
MRLPADTRCLRSLGSPVDGPDSAGPTTWIPREPRALTRPPPLALGVARTRGKQRRAPKAMLEVRRSTARGRRPTRWQRSRSIPEGPPRGPSGNEGPSVPARPQPIGFERFFRDNDDAFVRALCLLTRNRGQAEELAQDAFLTVWERWPHVREMQHPEGYLYRVGMNLFRKRCRRDRLDAMPIDVPHRCDEIARVDDEDEAARALSRLTPQQRSALVFSGLLGYPTDQVAALMGCRPSTVRVHLSRGRAASRSDAVSETG